MMNRDERADATSEPVNKAKMFVARSIWQRDNEWRRELKTKVSRRLLPCSNNFGFGVCHSARCGLTAELADQGQRRLRHLRAGEAVFHVELLGEVGRLAELTRDPQRRDSVGDAGVAQRM